MRVATLNVWGHDGDWPARRDALIAGFRALASDLVALQETVVTAVGDQVREILGEEFAVVHSQRRSPEGVGISVASRWPIAAVEEIPLAASPARRRLPLHGPARHDRCPRARRGRAPHQPLSELEAAAGARARTAGGSRRR